MQNVLLQKNTSLLTGGCSTHITSTGARTGIGQFDKRYLKVSSACQTSYDARPGTVRCPDGHRWNRTILILNKNRSVPVRCVKTPAGRRTVPGRCHFTLNYPTNRRTGAVEFNVVPKLHRAPYDV